MIDYFALALPHALIVIAVIRLMGNDALDHDDSLDPPASSNPGGKS